MSFDPIGPDGRVDLVLIRNYIVALEAERDELRAKVAEQDRELESYHKGLDTTTAFLGETIEHLNDALGAKERDIAKAGELMRDYIIVQLQGAVLPAGIARYKVERNSVTGALEVR